MSRCMIDGCTDTHYARGWCNVHYKRWHRNGTTDLPSFSDRFWQKVERGGDDVCWHWLGMRETATGYGRVNRDGREAMAHRVAYELAIGPIAEGLVIDHLCRVPSCVNPAHLEAVTIAENTRRGLDARGARSHCRRGHELTEENVYSPPDRRYRACLRCRRDTARRRARRLRTEGASSCR